MALPDLIIPYDPHFLGDGFDVPLPSLTAPLKKAAVNDGEVFPYTHYSLVMHRKRRTAIVAACNIDASRSVRLRRRNLPWLLDERVGDAQTGGDAYADNQLDRGHLVRRLDPVWGPLSVAKKADAATFFYTNSAPQHANFNQDEWLQLEDWVLENATEFSYRLCVFTGPVLRSDDPVLEDLPPELRTVFRAAPKAQIPAAFWKVIVLRDGSAAGEDLSVVAFAMRQSDMWQDKEGKRLLKLKPHQVTVQAIEGWTGLDFGALAAADELEWSEARMRMRAGGDAVPWPLIGQAEDIVLSGPFRRMRGHRSLRSASASGAPSRSRASTDGSRAKGWCECNEPPDAQASLTAISQRVDALASLVGQLGRPPADARSLDRTSADAPLSARVSSALGRLPEAEQAKVRGFLAGIRRDAQVRSGSLRSVLPSDAMRILGGEQVAPGGFLSCCCIGDDADWYCTGVLVAPRVVLTAAHCGGEISRILIGANRLPPFDAAGEIVPVSQVFVHERYNPYTQSRNDISLLILERKANQPPARLATPAELGGAESVDLVGFGTTDAAGRVGFGVKRQVNVIMGAIQTTSSSDLTELEQLFGFDARHEFVAGRKGLGKDSCKGDSGGPAYLPADGGQQVLAGITSRATAEATATCGDGGVYVRPDRYLSWINTSLASAGLPDLAIPS